MKLPKFSQTKKPRPIGVAVEKYRTKVQDLRKKLILAMKDYKKAVDAERVAVARRRVK